jgi:hypothetical protein
MKKLCLKTLLILMTIGLMWGCEKQHDTDYSTSNQSAPKVSETEGKILSFIERMNNPTKSGEEYTLDSTIGYIEATLNYTYSIWDSAFSKQKIDSAFITIYLNQDDNVDASDVSDAYDKLEDSLGVHWDNISGSTKHVIATDVSVSSNSGGTVVLKIVSAIGGGSGILTYGSFGDDDHWIWGWDLGGCGPNPATSSDASDELTFKYMHPVVTQEYANRVYFTDVEIYEYIVPGDYVDQNSPSGYRLYEYIQTTPITSEPCIEDDDLNYYLYDGIDYIVDDLEPTGFDFCDLHIIDDSFGNPPNYWGRRHVLEIWYGEIDQTSTSAGTP